MSIADLFASCTRRYIEGFEVLYSTNRFHISGMPLILHLQYALSFSLFGSPSFMIWNVPQCHHSRPKAGD